MIWILWRCYLKHCDRLKSIWQHFKAHLRSTKWILLFTAWTKWHVLLVENLKLNLDSKSHTESILRSFCAEECSEVLAWARVMGGVGSIFYSESVPHPSRPCFGPRRVWQGWPLLPRVAQRRRLQEPTNEKQVREGLLRETRCCCISCDLYEAGQSGVKWEIK